MAKSPSITILERDMSSYTVTSSSTVLAVVGYATKGPIGKATIVTSRTEFNLVFGEPTLQSPYAALAVYRAFNQGNQVIFYRVADATAVGAEVAVTNPIVGTSTVQEIETGGNPFTGLTAETEYSITVQIDGGDIVPILISTGVGETEISKANLIAAIALQVSDVATVVSNVTKIKIASKTIGTTGSVVITDGNLITDTTNADAEILTAVDGVDTVTNTTDNILFKAIEKGSSTNKIAIVKSSKVNPVTNVAVHQIDIAFDGEVVETYADISRKPSEANFFGTLINADKDNGGSEYVTVEYEENDNDVDTIINIPDNMVGSAYYLGTGTKEFSIGNTIGEYDFRVGTDGVPELLEDEIDLFLTALASGGDLGNIEEFDYHVLITPDLPESPVQESALTLANFRKDFIYVVDPPFGLKYDEVADWHNGQFTGRDSALNSSYAALYWPWLKDYNPSTNEYVWCPPSIFIAEKYMEIDRLYGPWYAPAGNSRGRISASDYETSPSFSQRELIYGDFNAVNPFVNFSSKGLLIYGQKTLLRENSALNRVNTRRMVIYIKKLVKTAMDSMLFEPHNPDSWRRAAGKINAILEPIRQNNGLDQYKVVIDATTNTADVIAQSIMKGTIKIVPTGTIEIIELTLQVHKAGASLDE